MSTSPNPATSDLTVTVSEESPDVKSLGKEERVRFELVELFSGQVVKQWNFKNDQRQFSLNIRGIRKGQYILKASIGSFKESNQVMIGE